MLNVKMLNAYSASNIMFSELREITYHMGSHRGDFPAN